MMRLLLILIMSLTAVAVGGCAWVPSAGPSTSEIVEEGQRGSEVLYDVVPVDDRVVSTLLAQPRESFSTRFGKDTQPPEIRIAIGDTVTLLIWESAAGGLFSEPPPTRSPGAGPETEPLAPESQPSAGQRRNETTPPAGQEQRPDVADDVQRFDAAEEIRRLLADGIFKRFAHRRVVGDDHKIKRPD